MNQVGDAWFAPTERVHFVGIGGIGMSGVAEILLTMGYSVSGSDLRVSPTTDRLRGLGARIFLGHAAENVAAVDVVVISSAVAKDNPEVIAARKLKLPIIQRAEMLAELMRLKYGIAIAGMHGKTTTTTMVAAVLAGGGLDPTVVVGGRVDALGSNARLGRSRYLVAEADESDRSFLKLSPILAVVTNLDREHMDSYADMADVERCFQEFMEKVPFYGTVTACIDDARLRAVLPRVQRRVISYGESEDAEVRLRILPKDSLSNVGLLQQSPGVHAFSRFQILLRGDLFGEFLLHVPGHHNVMNATAAVAVGIQLGLGAEAIAEGLANFRGVDRRFQVRGSVRGVTVVDDYGHHPTEIRATLQAARECGAKRVLVLFQPHRYTRTRDLMEEFAGAFALADRVEVLEIYAASELPIPGVSGELLAAAITARKGDGVGFAGTLEEGVRRLASAAQPGDLLLTLGAGSVSQAAGMLVEALESRE